MPYIIGMSIRVVAVMFGLAVLSSLLLGKHEPKTYETPKSKCVGPIEPGSSC